MINVGQYDLYIVSHDFPLFNDTQKVFFENLIQTTKIAWKITEQCKSQHSHIHR